MKLDHALGAGLCDVQTSPAAFPKQGDKAGLILLCRFGRG